MKSVLDTLPLKTSVGNHFISNYPPFSCWSIDQLPHFVHALTSRPKRTSLGLYVHLPFCRHRCHYCYFRVYPGRSQEDVSRYINGVIKELSLYRPYPAFEGRSITSVYFGGGSPSYLTCDDIKTLFGGLQSVASWDAVEECTFECEPGTVTLEKFKLLRRFGVTRLSLGFQTLSDEVLANSGRTVRVNDCVQAFRLARQAGFSEINIDLIAGLPGETEASWRRTVDQVLELIPDCVTVYQLELTHNSRFYSRIKAGKELPLPDWPEKVAWTDLAFKMCEQAGYTVGSGYMAVRDLSTWKFVYTVNGFWPGGDLIALGETSFGHIQGVHYQNHDRFEPYLAAVEAGHFPLRRVYKLNDEEKLRREVILQLKTGVLDATHYRKKFGIELLDHFEEAFETLIRDGLAVVDGDHIRLTRAALLQVDWLLPLFYLPEHLGVRYT